MTVQTLFVATRTRPPSNKKSSNQKSHARTDQSHHHHQQQQQQQQQHHDHHRTSDVIETNEGLKTVVCHAQIAGTQKTKEYSFDAVFCAESTNSEVYESVFLSSAADLSHNFDSEGSSGRELNVVETILKGGVATVFAYGATGSGKTHTMIGRKDDPGMMMRSMGDVFDGVKRKNEERRRILSTDGESEVVCGGVLEVRCSYVEVYNENLYDLLADSKHSSSSTTTTTTAHVSSSSNHHHQHHHRSQSGQILQDFDVSASVSSTNFGDRQARNSFTSAANNNVPMSSQPKLELREDPSRGGAIVVGAKEVVVCSPSHVSDLLEKGNARRKTDATDINATSSRSHAVLEIVVCERMVNEDDCENEDVVPVVKRGKLSLVDLAGSERANEANTRGDKLRDGASINKSLLALANCINALGRRKKVNDTQNLSSSSAAQRGKFATKTSSSRKPTTTVYVPYRDSKLTRLLKDGLSGKGKCVMIATVSEDFEQSLNNANTLSYANRAKSIEMIPSSTTSNDAVNEFKKNGEYRKVVEALQSEVSRLKLALGNALENGNNSPVSEAVMSSSSSERAAAAAATMMTTSSRLHGFFSRKNTTTNNANSAGHKKTSSSSKNDNVSSTMTDSIPFGRTPRATLAQHQQQLPTSGTVHSVSSSSNKIEKLSECKTCSSRITLDERVLQLCDEITENVEERVNYQKALFELEAADSSNRRELAKREKSVYASAEERVNNEKKLEKLREQHARHAKESKKYASEIARNDKVRDKISKKVDDVISGGGNYRGNIGLARSLSEYRLAVARNAELQFTLALRDQTVLELREDVDSLRRRASSLRAAASNDSNDIDNSSVSSFDDDLLDEDVGESGGEQNNTITVVAALNSSSNREKEKEGKEGATMMIVPATTSTEKKLLTSSTAAAAVSLFSDLDDYDDEKWEEYDQRSTRKSTPTAASTLDVSDKNMTGTGKKIQANANNNNNKNSLSARRRALAIERAALKAGNLSARGPTRSQTAIPVTSKYSEMIRDASLIFNRKKVASETKTQIRAESAITSVPITTTTTSTTPPVPKGSVKFNEARLRRKFTTTD